MRAALTLANIKNVGWGDTRSRLALEQLMLQRMGFEPGKIDGLWGQQTNDAWERWQASLREVETIAHPPKILDPAVPILLEREAPILWPRQAEVRKFYGEPGKNQTLLRSPYPLRLAWDISTVVNKFSIHEKCHDSALRAMNRVYEYYGPDLINKLGLDLFGGCLNVRKMKGGNALSMHSWGIAIDWDPEHNQLRWGANRANMDSKEREPFLDAWEDEGWLSLGRARNYDWMHVQAARL
jgi:hypothetical protein